MRDLAYYTEDKIEDIDEVVRDTCAAVGFETERAPAERTTSHISECIVSHGEWDFRMTFDVKSDYDRTDSGTPKSNDSGIPIQKINLSGASWFSDPWENGISQDEYQRRVDIIFEFICRLAMAIDVEYAPMLGFVDPLQCWPTDYPIADNIEELPIFGIYSQSALEELGGLETMFDRSLWYVAALPTGHTVILQEDFPWNRRDWSRLREADFHEATQIHVPTTFPGSDEETR